MFFNNSRVPDSIRRAAHEAQRILFVSNNAKCPEGDRVRSRFLSVIPSVSPFKQERMW